MSGSVGSVIRAAACLMAAIGVSEGVQAATPEPGACIKDSGDLKSSGTKGFFEITLESTCPKPVRCVASYNVTTAFGMETGTRTIRLKPGSVDRPTRESRLVPIKASVGSAILSKTCRFSPARRS